MFNKEVQHKLILAYLMRIIHIPVGISEIANQMKEINSPNLYIFSSGRRHEQDFPIRKTSQTALQFCHHAFPIRQG